MPVNEALLHGPFYGNYVVRIVGAVGFAYLFGSIAFGTLAGWLFGDFEPRIASTARGLAPLLDWAKAVLPVAIAVHGGGPVVGAAAAVAVVAGHAFCPWTRFRGPSPAAAVFGATAALSWPAGLAFAALWCAVALTSGYAALGVLAAAAFGVVTLGILAGPAAAFAAVAMLVVAGAALRPNFTRVLDATEPELRDRADAPSGVYLNRQTVQRV